jgi:hypothetical protein
MALIHYQRRVEGDRFEIEDFTEYDCPASFVVANIADGTPFVCMKGAIDVTENVDAMMSNGEFTITELVGSSVFNLVTAPLKLVFNVLGSLIPTPAIPDVNGQTASANNSLTDRTNKPRPYQRAYDICGTVQSIPSDLMQSYRVYGDDHKEYQYGYYYIARGYVDTPVSGITDGDTQLSTISGSAANIYEPFTSPNSGTPTVVIGNLIDEPLFIGNRVQSVDGIELKAPNEYQLKLIDVTVYCQLTGSTGSIIDATGTLAFDDLFIAGESVTLSNVKSDTAVLDGTYTVTSISGTSISFDVSANLAQWSQIAGGYAPMSSNSSALISPSNLDEAGYSDWMVISRIKPTRILANIVARRGMLKQPANGNSSKPASATAQLQWQALDDSLNPVGVITSVSKTLSDNTQEEVGMSIIADLPYPTAVRVRVRRSSNQDTEFDGQVTDVITYKDLYGQIKDESPHYGDLTTIHTRRKNTVQATSIKQPQLKVIATEMLYKYLGNGVFDTVRTANNSGTQSLIRIMRDPLIGDLDLSTECMDGLIAVGDEIKSYFGTDVAEQFNYTFDDGSMTAQAQAQIIAEAIFCTVDRSNNAEPTLHFERPQAGPAMLFTHRSKVGDESWTRSFGSVQYDSLEYTYTDPNTNIRETIYIPDEGGSKPRKIDSKGVRNYQQAYWLAHRARQKDLLQRENVDFTATEEGAFVTAGKAISVVKGTRVASYDGYIVAVNGLSLTLSQEVAFTSGDDHYIQLKRRDGTLESIRVVAGANARTVTMLSAPTEEIYTGNSANKTEFSFGNEARHLAQMIVPLTVTPDARGKTVKITGKNYHEGVFLYDGVSTTGNAYSDGYSDGYA